MTRLRDRRWILLLLALGLAACSAPATVYKQQFYSFGTIVEVSVWGVDETRAQRLFAQLQDDMDYMHTTWHAWHEGPVARINQLLPLGKEFSVAPSVLPLIENSLALYRKTQGLYNPAIGGLLRLWGFAQDDPPTGPPPTAVQIQPYLQHPPSMADLHLDGIRLRSDNPLVQLDFGAYAKGYAVDLLIARIREWGISDAIVNAGGNLRAMGGKGGKPWRIGIRDPRHARDDSGKGVLASLEVRGDESVFTSGNYERYFFYEGRRYHHIIDPRTGYPAQGSISATVIWNNGGEADAASTALFIAGPQHWPEVAASLGMDQVMVVDEAMHVYMTPAMAARVHFEQQPPPVVTVTALP